MTAPVEGNNDNDQKFSREFDELLHAKRKDFRRVAYRILRNHHDAEDAVQTAIAHYLRRRASGQIIENPVGFLIAVINRKAQDALDLRQVRYQFHVNNRDCAHMLAPQTDDRLADVRAAMAEMKPKLVQVLNLCCLEGYRIREAAQILGRPAASVATDLYRAKFEVRKLIRIQEKKDEAQKNQRKGIPGTGLAGTAGA
jgi:RNA polymerase sigma-70 factor (ECF subfamily)